MAATTTADTWRKFPRYMIYAMLVVVVVNVRFIYLAVDTFPGAATNDDFDTSNNYNSVLRAVAAQNALGWTEQASTNAGRPVLDLTGPGHKPLTGAAITAQAERPIGTDAPTLVTFTETTPGHYLAAQPLPLPGQWDLELQIAATGHHVKLTRRIVAK